METCPVVLDAGLDTNQEFLLADAFVKYLFFNTITTLLIGGLCAWLPIAAHGTREVMWQPGLRSKLTSLTRWLRLPAYTISLQQT